MCLRNIITIAIFVGAMVQLQAQPHPYWQPIDTGITMSLMGDLGYSANLDLVVFTGFGSQTDELGETFFFMPGFNNIDWENITSDLGYGILTFVDFSEGLLVGGLSAPFLEQNMPHMAYFDGEEWSFPYEFNGDIAKLKWVNDTLYALGWFTEIDGNEAYRVAALVDGVWEGRLSPAIAQYIPGWQITDIEYLNDEIYISGNFWVEPNSQSENLDGPIIGFGKLENDWIVRPTQEFYFVGTTSVRSLVKYQDKLYLGTGTSNGGPGVGHAIHCFDGSLISPVPHPPRYWYEEFQVMTGGGIVKLMVNGDYLYAGGEFNFMGEDTFTGKVARWDGNQWCGMFATEFEDIFSNMAFINDQMIIVNPYVYEYVYPFPANSYWLYTGGDAVSNCTEPLITLDDNMEPQLSLHPNPAHTYTTLSSAQQPIERLAVYDLQGRLVHAAAPGAASYRMPLAGLPAGMYVVSVQVGGEVLRKKLVVE